MGQRVVYSVLRELGGNDVSIQEIKARLKEKYPDDDFIVEKAGLWLRRLYRWNIVDRRYRGGKRGSSGFAYTIIGEFPS